MKNNKNGLFMQANHLCKVYQQGGKSVEVLRDVSLTLDQGQTYAVTGASGSGKSTLLHLLSGLDHPTAGEIWYGTQAVHAMRAKEQEHFRRHTIGFMFQFHYLIQELTVLDNCLLPARVAGVSTGLATEKAASLLESVGLADKQDRYPWQLSGGEQQRVSLARALVNQPAMLFADEPTGNLDADNAARMVELLLSCQRQWGMTVMICSHDAVVYKQMGHVFWLEGGTLRGA